MTGEAEILLDTWIQQLRAAPDRLRHTVMPQLALVTQAFLQKHHAAGTDPNTGEPWPKTKRGKRRAQLFGKTLTLGYRGLQLVATIKGFDAMHSRGVARGGIPRPMLPSKNALPDELRTAIEDTLRRELEGLTE